MARVLFNSWALLIGIGLLMVGNGMQASLMGVRGAIEEFTTFELSMVGSAYFLGFLAGSIAAPGMIRRVGHVRVFAALASFISAALILFPAVANPWFWTFLRVLIGLGFSGVYVVAESWLNNDATNDTRGKTLSAYLIVQTLGIISGQAILAAGDPRGFVVFIVPSVLVSISFAPILLSVSPTPPFDTAKRMRLGELFRASPLSFVSMILLGGVFASMFGMGSVYASRIGMSVSEVSTFISAIFLGSLAMQYPIGWLSDRMDRRLLIVAAALVGGIAGLVGFVAGTSFPFLLALGFVIGGAANPMYSLLIAHLNDYLETDQMAAASGGLIFINGLGAVGGPVLTGWLMETIGNRGFWLFVAALMLAIAALALYRMTQRAAVPADESGSHVAVMPSSTPVALELAQELAGDLSEEEADPPGVGSAS